VVDGFKNCGRAEEKRGGTTGACIRPWDTVTYNSSPFIRLGGGGVRLLALLACSASRVCSRSLQSGMISWAIQFCTAWAPSWTQTAPTYELKRNRRSWGGDYFEFVRNRFLECTGTSAVSNKDTTSGRHRTFCLKSYELTQCSMLSSARRPSLCLCSYTRRSKEKVK
jgi:hypothetical protein